MIRTLTVQEDPQTGDLFFEFPDEMMNELGWKIGDTLTWKEKDNGSWILTNENNKHDSTME